MGRLCCALVLAIALSAASARAASLRLVAAENFYGDVGAQIGGPSLAVTSILSNPDQDPHEFEANAGVARALAGAAVVVYNGAGYDPWAGKLLAATASPARRTIEVAKLVGKKAGDNPHIWYDPATMPAFAKRLTQILDALDPPSRADYARRLTVFEKSVQRLGARIAAMRQKYAGTPVTATEPVFGYMAQALGLEMRNRRFQLAVMNDTEPGAAEIARFERDLRSRSVKVLFYNRQTSGAITRRMQKIAKASSVPIVGVTETLPSDENYQGWMLSQLSALDRALGAH
jgi:zinc/manganese transport system substrate-binding protein